MKSPQAKITYLFHSGFTVETTDFFLIFDYYHPSLKPGAGTITKELLQTKPATYVFASHNHADHFDRAILKWSDLENVTYILSDDIQLSQLPARSHLLAPYQELTVPDFTIKTFGSTDVGISFLIEADGLTLFHAGDLNCWRWNEDTPEAQQQAIDAFEAEVAKIAGNPIDIAFFPVDRRLEEHYAAGALHFAARLQPQLLIPMHFAKDYEATAAFAALAQNVKLSTVVITHQGQEIIWQPA